MQEERLKARLAEVHEELERGPDVSDETARLLRAIAEDIGRLIERPEPAAPAEHETLAEMLRDATWNLEKSHPKLATAVSQLIETMTGPFQ